jgi:hypothetical protein
MTLSSTWTKGAGENMEQGREYLEEIRVRADKLGEHL